MLPQLLLCLVISMLAVPCAADTAGSSIDVHKIKPTQLLTGPYSYFVPPYSSYYFQHMDKLDFQFDWIRSSGKVFPLQKSKSAFTVNYKFKGHQYKLDEYLRRSSVLGFLVLKDNLIIHERYFHGADETSRFLSNSVGKSITSTLIGILIDEGTIAIDDPIIKYVPELIDSGFNRVTVKQALEMATAVDLSYDVHDPHSSSHRFNAANVSGAPSFMELLKSVKPKLNVQPGNVFDYENEDPEALGFVIEKVTRKSYSACLQQKIWSKIGAQSDAFLYRAKAQPNQSAFGSLSATLRDYSRFGLMMMNGGSIGGARVVSSSWVQASTTPVKYAAPMRVQTKTNEVADPGYGYLWWIPANCDRAFQGMGIFGQLLYVNPTKHIVIVQMSAWPKPDEDSSWDESAKVVDAIVAKLSHDKFRAIKQQKISY